MIPPTPSPFFWMFRVAWLYCRFTSGIAQTLNPPHPSRAHDTASCALALSQPELAGLHIGRVYVLTPPPHSRGRPSRPSRKPCLPSAGLVVPVSAAMSCRSRSCRAVTRTRCPCPSSSKQDSRTFTRTPAASSVCCVCCIWQRQARRPAHSLSSGLARSLQRCAVPYWAWLVSARRVPVPPHAQHQPRPISPHRRRP